MQCSGRTAVLDLATSLSPPSPGLVGTALQPTPSLGDRRTPVSVPTNQNCRIHYPSLPTPTQTPSRHRPLGHTILRRSIHRGRSMLQSIPWVPGHATGNVRLQWRYNTTQFNPSSFPPQVTTPPLPTPTPSPLYWVPRSPTRPPQLHTQWLHEPSPAASQKTWPKPQDPGGTSPWCPMPTQGRPLPTPCWDGATCPVVCM